MINKISILYVSCLCSKRVHSIMGDGNLNGQAVQKFHRLMATGFIHNNVNVTALSSAPVANKFFRDEIEDDIKYSYCNGFAFPVVRHIFMQLLSFLKTLLWILRNRANNPIIICDVLNISITLGALFAAKTLNVKIAGIVTDLPGLMVGEKTNFLSKFILFINKSYLSRFDKYILLTDAMNDVVNPKRRPYIVVEGLVDIDMRNRSAKHIHNRNIIYAGGLHERYGIKILIEAFMLIKDTTLSLSLYGNGPMADEIKEYEQKDNRIHYYGSVSNNTIIEAELKAILLINPRPTSEEFTKYSFPSKNMEYMVSGTPLLTTKLPGMPSEYYPYVFLIEDESIIGIKNAIERIISLSNDELIQFGEKAKSFVINEKNNIIQAKKIINSFK